MKNKLIRVWRREFRKFTEGVETLEDKNRLSAYLIYKRENSNFLILGKTLVFIFLNTVDAQTQASEYDELFVAWLKDILPTLIPELLN